MGHCSKRLIYISQPSEMASGGSHLLSAPSPRTQASHQPPSLAGCRRSPDLPGCPCKGVRLWLLHLLSLCSRRKAGRCFQDTAFPAPHPTLAICSTSAHVPSLYVPGARREAPHVSRPALQSVDGFALSRPPCLSLIMEV